MVEKKDVTLHLNICLLYAKVHVSLSFPWHFYIAHGTRRMGSFANERKWYVQLRFRSQLF